MKRFSERDPNKIAVLGLVVVALLVTLVYRVGDLPFLSNAHSYHAAFLDAGGLKSGDPVEVAGVKVGQVRNIAIQQTQIEVDFTVDNNIRLGTDTHAAVKVASLLGAKYLDVTPQGDGTLTTEIPLSRTVEAYDVVSAFADLTQEESKLNTTEITKSMRVLANTFADSPHDVRGAVRGLTRFSHVVASRNQEIQSLLGHAAGATKVLGQRSGDISSLVTSTNLLLAELNRRKAVIHRILVNTTTLADQLRGLANDNQADLHPALSQLDTVLAKLNQHQKDLGLIVKNLAMYGRVFTNTTGNGPWFDSWIPNIPDASAQEPQ